MPFAQVHYPFENRDWFETHFPGDFIVEYIGQTRGWFYTLHVLATALFDRPRSRRASCTASCSATTARSCRSACGTTPTRSRCSTRIGADAMRWALLSSPVAAGRRHGGRPAVDGRGRPPRAHADLERVVLPRALRQRRRACAARRVDAVGRRRPRPLRAGQDPRARRRRHGADGRRRPVGRVPGRARVPRLAQQLVHPPLPRSLLGRATRTPIDTLHTVLVTLARTVAPLLPMLADDVAPRPDRRGAACTSTTGRHRTSCPSIRRSRARGDHGPRARRLLGGRRRCARPTGCATACRSLRSTVGVDRERRARPVRRPHRRRGQREGGRARRRRRARRGAPRGRPRGGRPALGPDTPRSWQPCGRASTATTPPPTTLHVARPHVLARTSSRRKLVADDAGDHRAPWPAHVGWSRLDLAVTPSSRPRASPATSSGGEPGSPRRRARRLRPHPPRDRRRPPPRRRRRPRAHRDYVARETLAVEVDIQTHGRLAEAHRVELPTAGHAHRAPPATRTSTEPDLPGRRTVSAVERERLVAFLAGAEALLAGAGLLGGRRAFLAGAAAFVAVFFAGAAALAAAFLAGAAPSWPGAAAFLAGAAAFLAGAAALLAGAARGPGVPPSSRWPCVRGPPAWPGCCLLRGGSGALHRCSLLGRSLGLRAGVAAFAVRPSEPPSWPAPPPWSRRVGAAFLAAAGRVAPPASPQGPRAHRCAGRCRRGSCAGSCPPPRGRAPSPAPRRRARRASRRSRSTVRLS